MTAGTARESLTLERARVRKERTPFVQGIIDLRRNKVAMAGVIVFVGWLVIAILAPVIAPYDPVEQDLSHRLEPPSSTHWFGTDDLGRDIFSRVLYGSRISVPSGLIVVAASLLIGGLLGALAGFIGGWLDAIVMRAADVVLSFPSLILALSIAAARGGGGLSNALIAIVIVLWPEYARVMRGAVLALKSNEYVTAAQPIGATRWRILRAHILPGTQAPLVVKSTLDVGGAIVLTAGLSFIGLGAVPPDPEWGAMIALARSKFQFWWPGAFPALAMISVVLALNFIGDGLRDALDPRMRKR
ncbi:MAG: D,D-dipeptide ABC transporter permease [Chloroflexi bacterium]|nr:MAG: D,D-dipeptide ABC transporter permease [Chloroflexota bacterium]